MGNAFDLSGPRRGRHGREYRPRPRHRRSARGGGRRHRLHRPQRSCRDARRRQVVRHGAATGSTRTWARKPDYQRIVADIVGALGGLHILVNNAGIIRRNNAIDFTEADWDAVLDVNLKSVFFLSQAAARHMIPAGGGKIINIASMLSFQGGIRVPSYTASKSGIAGLTKLLANEWAVSGINVNAIAPGYFATNNTAALQADVKRNAEILGRIPAGRWGDPKDLGGAAVFLASSAANYVQGIILPVDGGWLAR